jgi:hypothetical protein
MVHVSEPGKGARNAHDWIGTNPSVAIGRASVKEIEPRFRTIAKRRVGGELRFVLASKLGVFGKHSTGERFEDVPLRILLLLKDGVEETPCSERVRRGGLEKMHGESR